VNAVLALDVGGTLMKAAVVDPDGQVLASDSRPTPGEHAADGVVSYAAELAAWVPDAVAVGLVVPGLIDEDSGFVHDATDVALRDVPLRELAQQRLGRVWTDAVSALACTLTTYTMLLDPELIVIGGGLAEAGSALLGPLGGALAERLAWRRPPVLAGAALGPAAGTFGAAILAWRAAGYGDAGVGWRLL
jgi:predicted NBD/HSP70 family sugar kinase